MSNAIQFLESLSRRPAVDANNRIRAAEIFALGLDICQQDALLERNANALSALLDGRSEMMMMVWAPQEESSQEDDSEPQEAACLELN